MNSRRNKVVPCALWGGLYHHWSFNFDKTVLIEVVAGSLGNFAAHDDVVLQRLAAQVEVAVLQTKFLIGVSIVHNFKGRGLRLCKNTQIVHKNFNVTGGYLVVDAFAFAHLALSHNDVLRVAGRGFLKNRLVGSLVES